MIDSYSMTFENMQLVNKKMAFHDKTIDRIRVNKQICPYFICACQLKILPRLNAHVFYDSNVST